MFLEYLIQGVILGAFISFIAIGYSLIYSILRFINFAHGEVMMIGAYLTYALCNYFGFDSFLLCSFAAVLLTGLFGVALERIAFRPLRDKDRLAMLLSSLGVSLALQSGISLVFKSNKLPFRPDISTYTILHFRFYSWELLILLMLAAVFITVTAVLKNSKFGLAVRGIAWNPDQVRHLGISMDLIISIAFFIASCLGATAGIFIGLQQSGLEPFAGFQFTIWAFVVIVTAGLGNIKWIPPIGILLGITIIFCVGQMSSNSGNLVGLGVLAVVLVFWNKGIASIVLRKF